ncbi:sporulation and cell division repeat protein [Nitrosococcus oceani AFC27]|nr:sporulation and cell division repeat protein [Nitrosococcus oceani AFC27]
MLIGVGIIIIPVLLGESTEILPEYKDSEGGDNLSSELEKSTFTSTVKKLPTQDGKKLPSVVSAKEEQSSASSSKETKWFIQIGSFGHRENALRIHRDVTSFGYKAFIETAKKGGETIYKVRVGPEKDGIRAKEIKQELERRLQTKAFVISPSDG